MQNDSASFRAFPMGTPLAIILFTTIPAKSIPGTINNHGTTLKTQASACGKLSWKYVGSHDSKMKKQLFWQKWQMTQALNIKYPNYFDFFSENVTWQRHLISLTDEVFIYTPAI